MKNARLVNRCRCGIGRLGRAIRRGARYRGMMVIVLWQAPIGPYAGADGSIGFIFGGGLDQYVTQFGCTSPTETASQRYGVAAVEFDHNLGTNGRVEAVAGGIMWNPDRVASRPQAVSSNGAFGHARLRRDGRLVGLGVGFLILPNMNHVDGSTYDQKPSGYTGMPSAYVRFGSAEGLHGRIDIAPPNALGSQQIIRSGIGWNATRRDQPALFVGAASLGSSREFLGEGVAGEATLPVSSRVSVRLVGHYGRGFDKALSGVAVGARFALGGHMPDATANR
jgi:hypothetical protein